MGTVCATPVEETASNGEAPWVGIDAEPLWKQVADEQIARKKSIKESWPEVEKELTARAFVKADLTAKEVVRQEVMEKKKKREKPKPKPKLDATSPASPCSPASPASPASRVSPAAQASPTAPPKAPEAPEGQARPKMVKLSKAQAKEALRKAVAIFEKPQNKKKLKEVVASCGEDGAQRIAALMPVVKGLLADLLESYDFPRDKLLQAVAQIAGHAEGDAKMTAQLLKLQAALEGDF